MDADAFACELVGGASRCEKAGDAGMEVRASYSRISCVSLVERCMEG